MIIQAGKCLGSDSVKDLRYEVIEEIISKPSKSVHVLHYGLLYMRGLDFLLPFLLNLTHRQHKRQLACPPSCSLLLTCKLTNCIPVEQIHHRTVTRPNYSRHL